MKANCTQTQFCNLGGTGMLTGQTVPLASLNITSLMFLESFQL